MSVLCGEVRSSSGQGEPQGWGHCPGAPTRVYRGATGGYTSARVEEKGEKVGEHFCGWYWEAFRVLQRVVAPIGKPFTSGQLIHCAEATIKVANVEANIARLEGL